MKKAGGLAAIGVLIAIAVGGCTQQPPPHVVPVAPPTVKPVFKSDAAALAAAKKSYLSYLAVSDLVLNDGGRDPLRLMALVTPSELKDEETGFTKFVKKGWHSTGQTQLAKIVLQGYFPGRKHDALVTYVCIDVSHVRVTDRSGMSMVSPTRPSKQQLQVGFDFSGSSVLVADQDAWSGSGVCD